MTDDWATFGAPVAPVPTCIWTSPGPGLRVGLMDALREAVRTGRLVPGTRLPSTRSLAADLGVARNTVADAYAELIAEGWLIAQQGSGTRVARRAEPRSAARRCPEADTAPSHATVCCRARRTSRSFPARSGSPRPGAL